jgi:small-conductance mechanosensitive channel
VGIVFAFPLLDRWMRRGIDDLFSGGAASATNTTDPEPSADAKHPDYASALHRIARVLLVLFLLAAMVELWGVNLFGQAGVRLRQAILASSLDLVTAILLAVIGWQFIKIAIDRRLAPRLVNGEMVQPSQRMQTLLPLARKFVLAILVVMTVMLLLSGLGVNIGPLLAGAGVVGVAIGFGAQTLVRDILTGVFFILDDAFRVGEYVISGTYKGTVEAIGLRAVKLRHHRGSIYTVPFGELHSIQNMSRDWVIDKFSIGITYDSDIEKARKIIKKIGQTLAEDPAYAPNILEPLKMQGVEQFGDFAVEVRVKMKTRPGEQFVIRRKANAMIKQAFDENGIRFAFPTVKVAGGDPATAAAASQGLKNSKPAADAAS